MGLDTSLPVPNRSSQTITQHELAVAKENAGALNTVATLPNAANHIGELAYTSDSGLVYSNGTTWAVPSSLSVQANVVPAGGNAGDVLTKNSSTDFDSYWDPPTPLIFSASFKVDAFTQPGNILISPAVQTSGWGSPTGTAITANYPGASATLPQTSGTLAAVITALKSFGILAA